jgi:2-iminobutanoate/2-iminopropanoate deaminase
MSFRHGIIAWTAHTARPMAALIAMSLPGCASSGADLPQKEVVSPPNYRPTPSPLSPAIFVGNTLYMSGSTGGDPVTAQLVPGGFEPEFRQIMTNLQTVLHAAGLKLSDVVSVTAYLADMGDYAKFNELYRSYFTTNPLPVRSAVAVKELARGAHIELSMVAVRSR